MTSRLQLISRVATGGFSTIDHARNPDTGVEVAVKRPKPGHPGSEEQLRHEGEVLALLRHAHIVSLIEAGEDNQGSYLALEWIDGEPLARRIERQPFDAGTLAHTLSPVLQALAAVHAAGFAHADLNASNVLLHQNGCVKLIDFGNAWPLGDIQVRTMADTNVGSIYHMAPELFAGQPPSVRSDLYALGVMAWHALMQRQPFSGDTAAQVITAHLHLDCPRLPPSPVSAWIHRLLSRDPAARPTSAREALQSLFSSP